MEISVDFTEEMDASYSLLQEQVLQDKKRGKQKTPNIQLLKAVDRAVENLKLDPHAGKHMGKNKIPAMILKDFEVTDIWKIDLPGFWRMLYSITGKDLKVICLILRMCDHKEYNRIFRFKKR